MVQKRGKGPKQETDVRRPPGCCPPRAMLWIDSFSEQIFVENSIQKRSRLDVRAALAQSIPPPPQQAMVQQAASDSELDVSVMKDQGKVYRTDRYVVHWLGEGECRPLQVRLRVEGEVQYNADCLPAAGKVTLSRVYLLEPPAYAPSGSGSVTAELEVHDCSGLSASCQNRIPRP